MISRDEPSESSGTSNLFLVALPSAYPAQLSHGPTYRQLSCGRNWRGEMKMSSSQNADPESKEATILQRMSSLLC
jgi:hypothetical protein